MIKLISGHMYASENEEVKYVGIAEYHGVLYAIFGDPDHAGGWKEPLRMMPKSEFLSFFRHHGPDYGESHYDL